MEFMQFHPTVLYIAGSSRSLITEAVRGEGAHPGRRQRPAVHARLRPAGRARPARRREPGDRRPDGEDAAPERLSRPEPSRRRARCARGSPASPQRCREFGLDIATDRIPVRPGAHYMIGGVTVDPTAARRSPGCGPPAKSPPAACTARIGWRRTACSKGWSTAPAPARRRRRPRSTMPDTFQAMPLENPPVAAAERAARPGRHPQLAQEPRCGAPPACAATATAWPKRPRDDRPLVPLRAAAAVHRPRRLGTAEHADRGPPDDRRRPARARNRAASTCGAISRSTDDDHWRSATSDRPHGRRDRRRLIARLPLFMPRPANPRCAAVVALRYRHAKTAGLGLPAYPGDAVRGRLVRPLGCRRKCCNGSQLPQAVSP